MPELRLDYIPLGQLEVAPRNPKRHQLDQLGGSISRCAAKSGRLRHGLTLTRPLLRVTRVMALGRCVINLMTRVTTASWQAL
jgi:hypothetical protein